MVGHRDDRLPRGGGHDQPPPRNRQAAGPLAAGRTRRLLRGPSGGKGGSRPTGNHEPRGARAGGAVSSPYGVLTLVCNLKAGRGGVAKCLPQVERLLAERGLEYELARTEGPGHATLLTREALERGRQIVVAVGGDGTIH